jgi:hypothetical protein
LNVLLALYSNLEARAVSRIIGTEGIAKKLGRPEPTVRSILARALRKLRDSIGETRSLHLPDRQLDFGGPNDE